MKKILVTGADGFIGRHVLKELDKQNVDYIAVDYSFEKKKKNCFECDIFKRNVDFYEKFNKPDIVLHLAWRDGFIHNSHKHMEDLSNHYYFLNSLIESGIKQIAILGSMHEIGYFEGEVNGNTPCNPLSQYGIAKNALRKSVEILCENKNICFQWLRAYYIYSNDMHGSSIFSKLMKANKDGNYNFPFTTGKNKYDFISIEELAKQIVAVITQDEFNGIINCCSGKSVPLATKIEEFIKENNLNIQLNYGVYPDRKYDSPDIWGNNEIIKKIMEK